MMDMTPNSGVDLCATCTHAFIREGYHGSRTTICQYTSPNLVVRGNTSKCSEYKHRNQPDSYELEKIAWIITSDPRGKIGFKPWVNLSREERKQVGVRRD